MAGPLEEKRVLSRHVVSSTGVLHQERTLTEWLEGIGTGVRGLMCPLPKTVEVNKH